MNEKKEILTDAFDVKNIKKDYVPAFKRFRIPAAEEQRDPRVKAMHYTLWRNRREAISLTHQDIMLTLPDTNGVYRMFHASVDAKLRVTTYQVVVYGNDPLDSYEY